MKQEFITLRGKVIVENETIRIKNFKPRKRSDFYYFLVFILLIVTLFSRDSNALPLANAGIAFLAVIIVFLLIEVLFINSWKNSIPLSSIKSYKVTHDDFDLETCVVIYLRSGKKKEIPFRTLEKQYGPFLELLSQQITQPLTA